MLGRLFAQQSDHTSPIAINNPSLNSTINSISTGPLSQNTDDVFTRLVLYGTQNYLEPYVCSSSKIRLLIIQNNGGYYERDNYVSIFDTNSIGLTDDKHNVKDIIPKTFGNVIYQNFDSNEAYKMIQLDEKSTMVSLHFKYRKNYAIILILPFSSSTFSSYVLPNWPDMKKYFHLSKLSFLRNHIHNNTSVSSNNNNPRIQSKLTSDYLDIVSIYKRFLRTFNQLLSTPRLLVGLPEAFNSVLLSWCNEVNNWIEIKDGGRNQNAGSHFLGSLLTLINDNKQQLMKPSEEEFTRIVIMTANPIVSQKLIFIISGLLSYPLDFSIVPENTKHKKSNLTISIPKYQHSTVTSAVNITSTTPSSAFQQQPSIINNGWEIPKTPSKSITTPSVLSHSNSVSNLNSISYLSSSLSNSYSQPTFSSSYISRSFQYLTNWGNISPSLDSNSSSTSAQSNKTPSPAVDYEEYPWNGLNNSHGTHHPHSSSFSSNGHSNFNHGSGSFSNPSSLQMSRSLNHEQSARRKSKMPSLPKIKRTCSTVLNSNIMGDSTSSLNKNEDLIKIMNASMKNISTISYNKAKNVSILNVNYDFKTTSKGIPPSEQALPKFTGYTQSYIPEFQLQACQISPDLESKVINSMKSDLSTGGYEKSKTIFVSLRAREIKEISMIRTTTTPPIPKPSDDREVSSASVSTANSSHSSLSSLASLPYLQQTPQNQQQEYQTRTRRFYSSGHPLGFSKTKLDQVNSLIKEVCRFVRDYQNGSAILEDEENDINSDVTAHAVSSGSSISSGYSASKKDDHGDVEKIRDLLSKL